MVNTLRKFAKILYDIKSVKIQGAENVARAGIQAYLLEQDPVHVRQLLLARPTEPLLQNAIMFLQQSRNKKKAAKKILSEIQKSHEKMVRVGEKLIKNEMNVYTHCHSSSVIDILKLAKKKKKKFVVYTTEVEPLLQGRLSAKDLAKKRIKVIVAPDLAIEQILSKCDLVLFGADAFTSKGVANKIGTSLICDVAKHHRIPTYSCGISFKFTKKVMMEKRNGREVWDERNKLIDIENPAFDFVSYKGVKGIISEGGVMGPKAFVKFAKKKVKGLREL